MGGHAPILGVGSVVLRERSHGQRHMWLGIAGREGGEPGTAKLGSSTVG